MADERKPYSTCEILNIGGCCIDLNVGYPRVLFFYADKRYIRFVERRIPCSVQKLRLYQSSDYSTESQFDFQGNTLRHETDQIA